MIQNQPKHYKNYVLIISLFITTNTFSQEFDYLPSAINNNQIVQFTQFTLSYNELHEQADWVAYQLRKEEATMDLDRNDTFRVDPNILTISATLEDYRSSGFDRGHLCPAADNNMSAQANRESFYMSNMSPQIPSFNQGIWSELEEWVRVQAILYDTVYIVTGPVFVNNLGSIGENKVTIPGYYFKALLRFKDNSPVLIGFLMPNLGCIGNIKDCVVPVNTIETLTGLNLYPVLNNSVENRIESQVNYKNWGFN